MNSKNLVAGGTTPLLGAAPKPVGHLADVRSTAEQFPEVFSANGVESADYAMSQRKPPIRGPWVEWSRTVFGALGVFLFLSVLWIERDAYRVGIVILGIVALFGIFLREFRPRLGWVEYACLAWTGVLAAWYFVALFATGYAQNGSSEGIYLYPALFPLLGYALFLLRGRADAMIWLFFSLSFFWLLLFTNESAILNGERVEVLFHKNTIHGSVAVGIMLIAALSWVEDLVTSTRRTRVQKLFGAALAFAVMALCFINIFGGKSKGIWLSLLLILPLQLLAMAWRTKSRSAYVVSGVAAACAIAFAAFFSDKYWAVAGPVALASLDAVKRFVASGFSLESVDALIAGGGLPNTLSIRLQLWMNALQIWQHSFWFGNGVLWENLLPQTRYADQPFNVFHNGYLEVAIRYGAFGLAFLGLLLATFVVWVRRATHAGLISGPAYLCFVFCLAFFLLSLLTNSNNRLAIGESFVLFAAAFAFCCHYWTQLAADPAEVVRVGLQ